VTRIPRILHYTFGLSPDFGGKPWSLVHHVCLVSAVERLKPEKAFLYHEYEPVGPWWELSKALVTPIKIDAPREIFGRPLRHVAHQSDVVRLQKLIRHGGIYLDADVFVQKSFDDLLNESTVLGQEGLHAEFGVANAVILAEENAPFLRRWYETYRTFRSLGRDEYWSEHSVQLPLRLADEFPSEITVLPHTAFYWPLWSPAHLKWIFGSNQSIPLEGVYANHLWEAVAWSYLEGLTPGKIRRLDTNFHRWAQPLLSGLPNNYGAPSFFRRSNKLLRDIKSTLRGQVSKTRSATGRFLYNARTRRRRTFQSVYRNREWGDGVVESEFFSGVGSRGGAAESYVDHMSATLEAIAGQLGRTIRVIDIGCGDFEVGKALLERAPHIYYIGCDIVPELIAHHREKNAGPRAEFREIDIVVDPLPRGDVCLIRQVLQHLPNADIKTILDRIEYNYVYVSEGQPQHRLGPRNPDKLEGSDVRFDWRTGRGRGVELDQPPYNKKTEKIFETFVPPNEIIVTERVL
jgi:hypothetical protein